jgi:uncharacterized membrane protein YfcA
MSHTFDLIVITFGAAIVNGALGYGFSSITVPLALLFLSNRVLNPALVLVEVVLNAWVLWVNRAAVPLIWRRVLPVLVGLLPGVVAGTIVISQVSPAWLKLITYAVLLPLILVQAAGYRRAVRAERRAGLPFGVGLGLLYSVTTISGPPLAIALNNQGLSTYEFRAALGLIRLTESTLTAIAYLTAGLFTSASLALVPQIVPGILIGVPIGVLLLRRVDAETFRRVCMSFDAWIVSFGISTLLRDLGLIESAAAYLVMAGVIAIDAWLLTRFFGARRTVPNVL